MQERFTMFDFKFTLSDLIGDSHKNAFYNVTSGLVINFFLTLWLFNEAPLYVAWASCVYFIASYARSYLIRKFLA